MEAAKLEEIDERQMNRWNDDVVHRWAVVSKVRRAEMHICERIHLRIWYKSNVGGGTTNLCGLEVDDEQRRRCVNGFE